MNNTNQSKTVLPSMLEGRALDIYNEVCANLGGYWSACDQGRLAHARGMMRNTNPWDDDLFRSHNILL